MNLDDYLSEPLQMEAELDSYFNTKQNLTIFEIGACEGEDTIKLRRRFPNAEIYAFEPLPKNIQRMKRNYKKYRAPGINAHQEALSDRDGKAKFYVSSGHPADLPRTASWDYGNKSSSLLEPKEHLKIHKWLSFKEKIDVKTRRLDSFCREKGIKKIDFIYLDVQGAELKVLEGAGRMLRKIGLIWMEVEKVELYANQPLKNEVEQYMKSHGFKLIKSTVDNIAGDQLYINSRLRRWRLINNLRFRLFL